MFTFFRIDYSDSYCYYTHGSSIKYRMLKLLELFENNQQHPVDSRKPFVEQSYPFFLLNYDDLSRMRFSSYNQKTTDDFDLTLAGVNPSSRCF